MNGAGGRGKGEGRGRGRGRGEIRGFFAALRMTISIVGWEEEIVDEAGGADPGGDGDEGAVGQIGNGEERVGVDDYGVVEDDAGIVGEDVQHGGAERSGLDLALCSDMERGEMDIFIGASEKVPEALKARFLLRDGFSMAQGKHHPRGKCHASLDDYCSLRHIMVSQAGDFSSPVDDTLATLSKTRKVVVTVSSYNQVALVLSSTDCVATLPSRLLQKYTTLLDILPLPFAIEPFEIAMAWHPSAQHDAGHQWLRERLVEVAIEGE